MERFINTEKNTDLIIEKAGKGGFTVLMNKLYSKKKKKVFQYSNDANTYQNWWLNVTMKVWYADNKKTKVVTCILQLSWYFTSTDGDIQIKKNNMGSRYFLF